MRSSREHGVCPFIHSSLDEYRVKLLALPTHTTSTARAHARLIRPILMNCLVSARRKRKPHSGLNKAFAAAWVPRCVCVCVSVCVVVRTALWIICRRFSTSFRSVCSAGRREGNNQNARVGYDAPAVTGSFLSQLSRCICCMQTCTLDLPKAWV